MKLVLRGEAHDYVGKSMYGGTIVIAPQSVPTGVRVDTTSVLRKPSFLSHPAIINAKSNVIAGNTILYGATGGRAFIAGRVGERFAVRNSGGTAVVEGSGDHACKWPNTGVFVLA